METVLLIVFLLAVAITALAIRQEKILKGYNPDAIDADADGWVQEGTKWERPTTLEAKKKAVKKKAAAKKAAPAKKAAKKK